MTKIIGIFSLLILLAISVPTFAMWAQGNAPFINTWLVLGTFDNTNRAGFTTDLIDESKILPKQDQETNGKKWVYFDDRLFSRNYDDYQDLLSYFKYKKSESITAKVAYAHVYVYSEKDQNAQLRYAGDTDVKACFNGEYLKELLSENAYKDGTSSDIIIKKGWNSILIKVANNSENYFGFFARICDANGNKINGLTYSVNGPSNFKIATTSSDVAKNNMPYAFKEWPYVEMKVPFASEQIEAYPELKQRIMYMAQASSFAFMADGGTPNYKWNITKGLLPMGIKLNSDGTLTGRVSVNAKIGDYNFTIACKDASGKTATKDFQITLKERPNKWFETDRLTGLMHHPQGMNLNLVDDFAKTMKEEGYGSGFMISYGNGPSPLMFKSRYNDRSSRPEVAGKYKEAMEKQGVKFCMYIGEMRGFFDIPFTYNQSMFMLEDAIINYRPAAFWFDWLGYDRPSDDAMYSAIKTLNPDMIIVTNGIGRPTNGDWDVLAIEEFSYGDYDSIWGTWPGEAFAGSKDVYNWPKKFTLETWRLMLNPMNHPNGAPSLGGKNNKNADWKDMLRLEISLISEGWVADMDHSPTAGFRPEIVINSLDESPIMVNHIQMAKWASPAGLTPLYESYTKCYPAPVNKTDWGYTNINLDRDTMYMHFMINKRGKTGIPTDKKATISPVTSKVVSAVCMNNGQKINFTQTGSKVTVDLSNISQDDVDTIVKLKLDKPIKSFFKDDPYPVIIKKDEFKKPGDLAYGKPSVLLSLDGKIKPGPSAEIAFASKGNDGDLRTSAAAGYHWAWRYEIDMEKLYQISKINITFDKIGKAYATSYVVYTSEDRENWTPIAKDENNEKLELSFKFKPMKARYVRIDGLKPDGPNQKGGQMNISLFEVYK